MYTYIEYEYALYNKKTYLIFRNYAIHKSKVRGVLKHMSSLFYNNNF